MRRAVFLDRDGTLMEDTGYVRRAADVRVLPGVAEALAKLKIGGFVVVVVTNQSGIGRGIFGEDEYRAVEAEFLRQVGQDRIDATYVCFDHPDTAGDRRKPNPGMLFEAANDLGLDLAGSFLVGDKAADVEAGRRAGVSSSILVRTGKGAVEEPAAGADFVAADFPAAVAWILQRAGKCG